ncbi:30S ribosomal protein S21 [Patescibacteria group bacterium]|nr:30S ribosomal protein S21 [Patescibacteria group bacterium]
MVEVKRKDGETPESLLRRFSKRVQQSGVLLRAKKNRFYEKPKNKRTQKEEALRRKAVREKKEHLKKIGKLEEFEKSFRKKRR